MRTAHPGLRKGLDLQHIAIVGAGPSGIYAADQVLRRPELQNVQVDLFEKLPTPFGLLRYGVAPDHIKIKGISKLLNRILSNDRIRFIGDVSIGTDVALAELTDAYGAVILATGAAASKPIGIAGEDLPGNVRASDVVSWYNSSPDGHSTQLRGANAIAIVGVGNVSLDMARILITPTPDMSHTDVPDAVLAEIGESRPTTIHIVGRRGVVDAKFTPPELRELAKMPHVDIVVDPRHVQLTADQHRRCADDAMVAERVEIFRSWAERERVATPTVTVHFHFDTTPVEVIGEGKVEGLRVAASDLGSPGSDHVLAADAVISSIGYVVTAPPGAPACEHTGIVANELGRVGERLFVTGWAKRGPSGVIGTNKACAVETVDTLCSDPLASLPRDEGAAGRRAALLATLEARSAPVVDLAGWTTIDAAEQRLGLEAGRTRIKISELSHMRLIASGGPSPFQPSRRNTAS